MKVLYDHQTFTNQNYGGISRYFCELFNEFNNIKDIDTLYSICFSNNHYLTRSTSVPHYNFIPYFEFRGKNILLNLLNKPYSIKKLKDDNFDIFHPTYYDPYFLKYIGEKPYVLTIHDMIHEKFPEMFPRNNKITQNKKLLAENASKIIAISESTKNDLIDIFGIEISKIDVVYHGNSLFENIKNQEFNYVPGNYLLYVGSRGAYKNFNLFIRAIHSLIVENSDLSLVCVGGGKFTSNELKLFKTLNIRNKVYQYSLEDSELAEFYKNAIMFIFPSLYEGFGIPILEAFACNCPVVCSNTSSLPEVSGNAAIYFDPFNYESILKSVEKVYFNPNLRNELIRKGVERAKDFSWHDTALKTKNVYDSIL
jgi:glycosyltransferase involved in cell wall biosynthesis